MAFSLQPIVQDVRYALRQLRRSPGFAATAILTLALGIGATTAIFTLAYQVILRSLPVSSPGQLYKVGKEIECCVDGGMQDDWRIFSYDLYKQLRDHTPGVEALAVDAGTTGVSARQEHSNAAQPLAVRFVSGNYFSVLGVQPFAGRMLRPQDDAEGAAPVAVLSHTLWVTKFASDPNLVGSTLLLTGHPVTVAGIAAEGFLGERNTGDPAGVWMPIAQEPMLEPERSLRNYPNAHWLDILMRIPDAHAVKPAERSIQVQLVQWLRANRGPGDNTTDATIAKQTTELAPASGGVNDLRDQYEKSLRLLLLIAGATLLICCANLANLMLVRAIGRQQEISVRTALGAPRWQLVRQMLVEAVVIALLGGVCAIAVAYAGTRAMLALAMKGVEVDPLSATPSLPVLLFALGLSLLTGILFGIAPAFIASRANPADALRGANRATGGSGTLPQRILVILQAALSVTLLSMAGLLITSLRNLQHQDFHFEPQGRLIAFIDLQAAGYHYNQLAGLYRRFDQTFPGLPGIQSFTYGTYAPMSGNNWGTGVAFPGGDPMANNSASYLAIAPHYFETLGIRVLLGRPITENDTSTSTHVAVINKAFADKYLKGKQPIGEHFGTDRAMTGEYEIVGVAESSKYASPGSDVRPMFFTPITQLTTYDTINATPSQKEQSRQNEEFEHFASNLIVHYQGDPTAAANLVRTTLHAIDPNIPIDRLITYTDQVGNQFTQQQLVVRLTAIFGALALLLASVGLYGVTSYAVARRIPEIGLRMALGSDRGGILRLILRGAMTQTLIGLALGIPAALLAGHFLQSQLFGIKSYNAPALLGSCALLALSAFVASLVPARRASAIEPMQALRGE